MTSDDEAAAVQHDAVVHAALSKRWPQTMSDAWWSFMVEAATVAGATRMCEIGCDYGRHVRDAPLVYCGVDYGYFVEFGHQRRPADQWVKIDFDRCPRELWEELYDPNTAYFVRSRVEHVRDLDLLLDVIASFAQRGALVVVSHEAAEHVRDGDELSDFFRRRVENDVLLEAAQSRELSARVLGRVPPPDASTRRQTLVAIGSAEQLDALGDDLERLTRERSKMGPPEPESPEADDAPIVPEAMLITPELPLLSQRTAHIRYRSPVLSDQAALEHLLAAKQRGKPFSLVRLGNGEARVLGFPDFIPPVWLTRSFRNWFGSPHAARAIADLQDEAARAVRSADVLGVVRERYTDPQYELPVHLLERYGMTSPTAVMCDPNIHLRALHQGFYEQLLAGETGVSLVCGHDIQAAFGARFGLDDVKLYKVPAQAKFFKDRDTDEHWPDVYERLRSEIQVRWPGEVFLVGAGFLGKIYCGWIKERGGIALDAGSVFDLWAGEHTRGSDPTVAERNRL